jgi:hypothetical protein
MPWPSVTQVVFVMTVMLVVTMMLVLPVILIVLVFGVGCGRLQSESRGTKQHDGPQQK